MKLKIYQNIFLPKKFKILNFNKTMKGKAMEELQIFKNKEFGEIRTVTIANKPWFVGRDVALALRYSNTRDALAKHVDAEDKADVAIHDGRQNRNMVVVNESGLYALVFGSRLESAKRFKHWVTSEVLPSIRKSGGYIAGQESMSDAELLAKAVLVAQKQIEDRDKQIERMKPKEIFADAVTASKSSILIGDLAKLICQNGVKIGQKRLFQWMRDNGYLIRQKGASWNMPTQRGMEMKLFEVKETTVTHSDGHISVNKTVKVTGKGQLYFINKFLDKSRHDNVTAEG